MPWQSGHFFLLSSGALPVPSQAKQVGAGPLPVSITSGIEDGKNIKYALTGCQVVAGEAVTW